MPAQRALSSIVQPLRKKGGRGGPGPPPQDFQIQAKMVHFANFYPKMRHFWAIFWSVPPPGFLPYAGAALESFSSKSNNDKICYYSACIRKKFWGGAQTKKWPKNASF